jgi:phosphatidylserine/phosphatidylglycerophosphate/cardiolipin synthase-like enzyme
LEAPLIADPFPFARSRANYTRRPISFAPNGVFEFKVALKKAIEGAERYIFIADQSLSALEVMDWLGQSLMRKPNLKVILLHGADPADPPSNFLAEGLNNHLWASIPAEWSSTRRNVSFHEWYGNAVHCKVTIIDDTWCAIGSANCMRRSLYTDIELSVAILEQPTPDLELPATWAQETTLPPGKRSGSFVQRFRRDLWAHYCGIDLDPRALRSNSYTKLLQLDYALAIWNPSWGVPVANLKLREEISAGLSFPHPTNPGNPFNPKQYNLQDTDSRQSF